MDFWFDYTNGKFGGADFDRRKELWRQTFPAVDLDKQLLRMANWLLDHSSHPKKQIGRFVTGWLRRQQEDAELIKKNDGRPPITVRFHKIEPLRTGYYWRNQKRNAALDALDRLRISPKN